MRSLGSEWPPFDSLGVDPDYLLIGAVVWHRLEQKGWAWESPPATGRQRDRLPDAPASEEGRQPASAYVGVTVYRGCWFVQYRQGGARKSKSFPLTPEGERQAAIDRARGLGLDYLERRDGTREALDAAED